MGVPLLCASKPPGLRYSAVDQLRRFLRRLRPDVVHTHQVGALLYAGAAARREKVRAVIHTEHINNVAKSRTLNRRIRTRVLWRLAGSLADRFCCVADDIAAEAQAYRTVPAKKIAIVYNGIDTATFANFDDADLLRMELRIPRGAPVIGTLGRLNEVKRQDLLIRSFAAITELNPRPQLLLVGDGPELAAPRRLATELGVGERVHFAGYQDRPEHYLHLMDIFALTSRMEGMPLAILEAWAAGRPVISTRVGGVPAIVTDGQNGLLIDSGDEEALTRALRRLITRPDEARRLGDSGQNLARSRFDLRVMAAAYSEHYRDLLSRSEDFTVPALS